MWKWVLIHTDEVEMSVLLLARKTHVLIVARLFKQLGMQKASAEFLSTTPLFSQYFRMTIMSASARMLPA